MPLPKPREKETQDEFIGRCMSDLKEEFPDQDQRLAVCFRQWKEKDKKDAVPYYSIKANGTDEAEILLYGEIGESFFEESNGAKEFIKELKGLGKVKNLNIRINSGGGSVFEGLAIYNAIDRHSANKTVFIDGLAASIASLIAMSGNRTVIAANAMMMIHNPFGMVMGDAKDMRLMADALDKAKDGMITSYQRKSKLPTDEISKLMNDETWMTANEALRMGFVDEVGNSMKMVASFNLSRYKKVPNFLNINASFGLDVPENKPKDKTVLVLTELPSAPLVTDPNPSAILPGDNSKPQLISSDNHLINPETLDRIKQTIGGKIK